MTHSKHDKNAKALDKIAFPHDRLFKESLSYVPIARDFFQHNLPDPVLQAVDLDTLALQPNAFMKKDGKSHFKDLVYRVDIKHKPGHLFLLWEHQSSAEPWMALRVAEYLIHFLRHCVKQQYKKLPPVVCCVFYHGQRQPYPYSCDFFDLFEDPAWARANLFQPFHLVDLTQKSDEELLGHGKASVLEILEKNIRAPDILSSLEKLKQGDCLESLGSAFGDYTRFVINYILQEAGSPNKDAIVDFFSEALPEQKEHMMNIAQQFRQEGLEEGIEKGRQEGLEKGIEKGLEKGRLEGHQEGRQEGRQEGLLAVAKTMLSDHAALNTVARYTKLSLDKVKQLQQELNKT